MASIAALALLTAACGTARAVRTSGAITLGALYPVSGPQGVQGTDEYRGVQLAVDLANHRGGVRGRAIRLDLAEADSSDQAARAVGKLVADGVPAIIGSHGSTISAPAADAAARAGKVFWETGAIGMFTPASGSSPLVFRFAPTGASLGEAAVRFAREALLPAEHRAPQSLRYAVTYVNDAYGSSVGVGATDEIHRAGLPFAGAFPYDPNTADFRSIVRRIAAAHTDVLFVAAYLADGVALRREMLRQRIPLVASVGTSSSYCMEEFGVELKHAAVGLFASDKPDGWALDAKRLQPDAAAELEWARATFKAKYGKDMPAGALIGFAGAWALIHDVLPNAATLTPAAIAAAARTADVPTGALPNGSGLKFPPPGTTNASANMRATSVVWEWIKEGERAVVWPPAFATHAVVPLPIS